ncbi:MAG: ATP-binding protein [Myxococcales bacterium]|nr:ATP-binding protein [Myxococcales bacterium]
MLAKVRSAGVLGIDAFPVEVEVDVALGLPAYHLVGLPTNAVKEGGVRVRAALTHSGFKLPPRKVTVNLAPADVRKDGAAYDLPTAVAILAALEMVPRAALEGLVLLGELALDGTLRRVAGGLPVAIQAFASGARGLVMPRECASEAASVSGLPVYAASTLPEVAAFLRGECDLPRAAMVPRPRSTTGVDLAEVRGLETARRALEVAAAGGHNLLLIGPPGSGKSMLARRLPTILPPLDEHEAVETTAIYSAAGTLAGASLLSDRPFRAPHHDVSVAGLVGGGSVPRPGEISLAHHGVLFLDELPEFKRAALEALRQPLEDRRVTIVRARAAITYPASFALIGALNPCPCGYRGSPLRGCTCSPDVVRRYLARLSGPLLDRIDLHVEVPHIDYRALRSERDGEPSATVRERVLAAREIQKRRARGHDHGRYANAHMGPRQLQQHCRLDATADRHLEACVKRFALSGRAVHRILRVARTVADLAGREHLAPSDVAEAVALRALDRPVT